MIQQWQSWPPEVSTAQEEYQEYSRWCQQRHRLEPFDLDQEAIMKSRLVNPWLVGCDPEFVMLNEKGEIVNTSELLPHTGVVGWDHSGHVVEIRPEPAKGTYTLVKHIQQVIKTDPHLASLARYRWRAGAAIKAKINRVDGLANPRGERTLTLGGHIHLDLPPSGVAPTQSTHNEHNSVIAALDNVTKQLEGLDVLPRNESQKRRSDPEAVRNHYGAWGNWRAAGDRGTRTEYRVMASWLTHPWQAFTCLTLGKLAACAPAVACETLKGESSFTKVRNFVELFRHKDMNAQRLLERILDTDRVGKLQFDPNEDFRKNWEGLGGL